MIVILVYVVKTFTVNIRTLHAINFADLQVRQKIAQYKTRRQRLEECYYNKE